MWLYIQKYKLVGIYSQQKHYLFLYFKMQILITFLIFNKSFVYYLEVLTDFTCA